MNHHPNSPYQIELLKHRNNRLPSTLEVEPASLIEQGKYSIIIQTTETDLINKIEKIPAWTSNVRVLDWSAEPNTPGINSFNPIDPSVIPDRQHDYLGAIADLLIPCDESRIDNYFNQVSNTMLVGFLTYIIHKISVRGDYTGLPNAFLDLPASLPLLTCFLQNGLTPSTGDSAALDTHHSEWLSEQASFARLAKYPAPAINAFEQLAQTPRRQADALLSIILSALAPFGMSPLSHHMKTTHFNISQLVKRVSRAPIPTTLLVKHNPNDCAATKVASDLLFTYIDWTFSQPPTDENQTQEFELLRILPYTQVPQVAAAE